MLNNKDLIVTQLHELGLTHDEAKIYLELLREPSTHLGLSHATGVNRTKIYRLIEHLEKLSLVTRRTDDRGTFLVATDPSALEIAIINQETKVKKQQAILKNLLPTLQSYTSHDQRAFVVRTYEGIEGLKQMCWHELQTKDELLCLGGQRIEDLIGNHRWSEKHRLLTVQAGYSIRVIINEGNYIPLFTSNKQFMGNYEYRQLPDNNIYFNEQITIYNDTVAIYHWRENQKVGVEIISESYATMMHQFFEHLWQMAKLKI